MTTKLPVGIYTVQLMVNDGHASSQADGVKITVVGPLECAIKVPPSTINLRGWGVTLTELEREHWIAAALNAPSRPWMGLYGHLARRSEPEHY